MSITKFNYLFFGLQIGVDVYNIWFWKFEERRLFWKEDGGISLQAKGHITVFVRAHARPFLLPLGKLCSNAPQDIRSLQALGR